MYLGQLGGLLGAEDVEDGIGQSQGHAVEETQSVANRVAARPAQSAPVVQEEQVVLDFPGLDAVRAAPIVAGESDHGAEVGLPCVLGQPANGHVVDHALARGVIAGLLAVFAMANTRRPACASALR